jgi:hypothetical protein
MPNDSLESQLSSQLVVSSLCFGAITLFVGWQWWSSEQAIALLLSSGPSGDPKEFQETAQALKQSNFYLGLAYAASTFVIATCHHISKSNGFMDSSVVQPLKALTSSGTKNWPRRFEIRNTKIVAERRAWRLVRHLRENGIKPAL